LVNPLQFIGFLPQLLNLRRVSLSVTLVLHVEAQLFSVRLFVFLGCWKRVDYAKAMFGLLVLVVDIRTERAPEDDVLDSDPAIVDDLALKRQQGDTRNRDWKCGFIPQLGEREPNRTDCVCFWWFCPIEKDRVVLSIADDDELSGDEVSPCCDLFEISF